MKGLFGLLLVGLAAFVVSRGFFTRLVQAGRVSTGPSAMLHAWASAGALFLIIGVGLGPVGVGLFTRPVLLELDPLVDLMLGWVGWLLGVQLSWKDLKRVPGRVAAVAVMETALSGLVVAMFLVAVGWGAWGWDSVVSLVIVATVASVSSPMLLALALGRFSGHSGLRRSLAVHTTLSPVFAVVLLGLVQAFVPLPRGQAEVLGTTGTVLLGPMVGLLLGALFHLVTLTRLDDKDLFVVVVGFVALGSGMARMLGQSPLFVNLVAGFVVALRSRQRTRLFLSLREVERPFYLLLLVALGAVWRPPQDVMTWVAVGAMTAGRLGGKGLGAVLTDRFSGEPGQWWETFLALLGHGGVVVAMAMTVAESFGSVASQVVLTYAVLSVLASPLLVPLLRRRLLAPSQTDA